MNLEKFGNFIKELRKEKGLNQEELADELHVHRTTVVKWESGSSLPLNDTLVMLSKYFNVTVDELLAGGRINNETPIEEKNKVTLSLLKSRRKSIRIAMYFAIISFIIFIIFLIYYFFTTYNSIHAYLLYGEGNSFKTRDGLLIVSNESVYLKLGNIYNKDNELIDVKNISLYLDNEYNTDLIFNGDPKQLLVQTRRNVEIFKNYNMKENYSNKFYLIINYGGHEEIIKLEAVKDFENKSLVQLLFRNTNENYIDNNFEIKLSDKFVYDKDTETYKLKDGNVEIECIKDNFCKAFIIYNDTIITYKYDKFTTRFYYQVIINDNVIEKVTFNLNNDLNKSEQKIYNEFKENILDKYLS